MEICGNSRLEAECSSDCAFFSLEAAGLISQVRNPVKHSEDNLVCDTFTGITSVHDGGTDGRAAQELHQEILVTSSIEL